MESSLLMSNKCDLEYLKSQYEPNESYTKQMFRFIANSYCNFDDFPHYANVIYSLNSVSITYPMFCVLGYMNAVAYIYGVRHCIIRPEAISENPDEFYIHEDDDTHDMSLIQKLSDNDDRIIFTIKHIVNYITKSYTTVIEFPHERRDNK